MVDAKPWKFEAIARLGLRIFLCIVAGSLVLSAGHYSQSHHHRNAGFWVLFAAALVFLGSALLLLRRRGVPDLEPEPYVAPRPAAAPGDQGHAPGNGMLKESLESPTHSGIAIGGAEYWSVRRVALVAVAYYAGLALAFWAESLAGPQPEGMTAMQVIVSGLSLQGAALVLLVSFVHEHGLNFARAFGFRNDPGKAVLTGVLAACLILPVALTLLKGSALLMQRFHLEPKLQSAVEALGVSNSRGFQVTLGIYAVLLAPAAEEMLFRGVLYPAIKQAGFPKLAWGGTALLFAAIHLNLPSFVPLVVLALVLTLLYERTNNLAASITAHALFNFMNFAYFFVSH